MINHDSVRLILKLNVKLKHLGPATLLSLSLTSPSPARSARALRVPLGPWFVFRKSRGRRP